MMTLMPYTWSTPGYLSYGNTVINMTSTNRPGVDLIFFAWSISILATNCELAPTRGTQTSMTHDGQNNESAPTKGRLFYHIAGIYNFITYTK